MAALGSLDRLRHDRLVPGSLVVVGDLHETLGVRELSSSTGGGGEIIYFRFSNHLCQAPALRTPQWRKTISRRVSFAEITIGLTAP